MTVQTYEPRTTVTASALGNYLGVGFNTPQKQFEIDKFGGSVEFDDNTSNSMMLGRALEDGVLNYFEEYLGITITDRNTETITCLGGKLRCKVDGKTTYNGLPTVVECKVSSGSVTNNLQYILQCQSYCIAHECEQVLLLGLAKGKPFMKLIHRDDAMIEDIIKVVDFVYDCLNDIKDFSTYGTTLADVLAKYNEVTYCDGKLAEYEDLLMELFSLKTQIDDLEEKKDVIVEFLKENVESDKYKGQGFTVSVSSSTRKSLDKELFMKEHPEIDLDAYNRESEPSKSVRITINRKKSKD